MSAVLDAISGGRGLVVAGLVASLPGDTYRVARTPYTSLTGPVHFDDRVLNFSRFTRAASDREGNIAGVPVTVRVEDTDRRLARIYEGSRRGEVRGSAAVIYLMTNTVAYNTLPVFVGIVSKLSFPAPFQAEFTLKTNDDQLQRLSPSSGWAPNRVTWPRAKADVFDKSTPLLYGLHDASYTRTGPGMAKCHLVDTAAHVYLVCAGKAKSIIRVYVNDVVTDAGNYTVSYTTIGGRVYTIITFTASIPTDDQVVTCDAQGLEPVGDASGAYITNPATQWAHRLTNFVLGDATGTWLSTNALIDSTLLASAEAHLDALGARASTDEDERRTGKDITAAYCKSFGMRSFWTRDGKIAMRHEDIHLNNYSAAAIRWYRDELGEFNFVEDDYNVTNRMLVRQALDPDGSYLSALELVEPSASSDTQDSLDLEMSEAR